MDARGGDKAAFATLVVRHRGLVVGVCRRLVGDEESAKDIAQEAVLRALVSLDRLSDPERFSAWLCGIALNVARASLRDRARARNGTLPSPYPAAGADEEVVQRELATRVRAAVAHLAPGQRDAVMLFYLEGLTHREVAAELGISVNAVKARLHQARTNLRPAVIELGEPREERPVTEEPEWVDVRVAEVRRAEGEDNGVGALSAHVVVLAEERGSRQLPIWIGAPEGMALALSLASVEMPRPMTYQLASSLLAGAGARVVEVRVTRLADSVFYAVVLVEGPAGTREVDARPSDALNLALVCGAPIRVHAEVLADPRATERTEWQSYGVLGADIVAEVQQWQTDFSEGRRSSR